MGVQGIVVHCRWGLGASRVDRVLIVEDDSEISELVTLYLTRHGFEVASTDGWDAVEIVQNSSIDLVLLDIMLPGPDGFELCQELRKHTDVPILFMSSKSEESDKILGLNVGADDYVTKPFSPSELVARVKAQLRRYRSAVTKAKRNQVRMIGDMEIDEDRFVVRPPHCGETALSAKEFQILMLMGQNPDHVYRPEELFQHIWNSPSYGDARTVMVHISNLRKKIEADPAHPRYIVTIRGGGYKFMAESVV